jgi:hypothetical protein
MPIFSCHSAEAIRWLALHSIIQTAPNKEKKLAAYCLQATGQQPTSEPQNGAGRMLGPGSGQACAAVLLRGAAGLAAAVAVHAGTNASECRQPGACTHARVNVPPFISRFSPSHSHLKEGFMGNCLVECHTYGLASGGNGLYSSKHARVLQETSGCKLSWRLTGERMLKHGLKLSQPIC